VSVLLHKSVQFIVIAICLSTATARALAEQREDLCSPPKMQTEKWPGTEQVAGATILLPPGFRSARSATGGVDEKYFVSGHREIIIGAGATPKSDAMTTTSVERISTPSPSPVIDDSPSMIQRSSCETTINGRRVEITLSSSMSHGQASLDGGASPSFYVIVAHFLATPPLGDMFIAFETDSRSEISSYRQIFWTATFDGSVPTSSAPAKSVALGAGANASPPCIAKPDPSLPAADAVLDTALLQALVKSSGPPLRGFALLSLTFNGSGELTNISVAQSDLPDAAQRQLATLVASNLEPHDKHAPSKFMLRVDAQDAGLHYATQPACSP
jgi:hypothetical protein